jgi:hypothetical protein
MSLTATTLTPTTRSRPERALPLAGIAVALLAGCGSTSAHRPPSRIPRQLLAEERPIGAGPRFQPPVAGPVLGRCRPRLGARAEVHVELFAANRVVIVPAGIGTRPPRAAVDGRITSARCYGDLVTIDPTGIVLVRPGSRLQLGSLFRSWGQQLSEHRLASFGGGRVVAFVDGRRWDGRPANVPLAPRSELVLEIGPRVPPHASFTFPPGA